MIIWFSGNGNSRLVAREMARRLGDSEISLTEIEGGLPKGEERIVWVFPVYSWGIPPVVLAFMRRVEMPDNACHYLVVTCGDDIGYTDRQWAEEMRKRGIEPKGEFSVTMPNTYVLLPGMDTDPATVELRKLSAASGRIGEIAGAIESGETVAPDVVRGAMPGLKSKVLYPLFVKYMMSPRPFHSTDGCTGCGSCVKACPLRNITMRENRPVWGRNCALCLGCYHACPHHAVAYGRRTGGKHQYKAPNSLG